MTIYYAYVYTLASIACTILGIAVTSHISYDMGSKQEIKAFKHFLIVYIGFVISNMVCLWANYFKYTSVGLPASMINLITVCGGAYFWFNYVELKIDQDKVDSKQFQLFSGLPVLFAFVMIVSTPFTRAVFYYDSVGEYTRGPLYIVMLIIAFLYITWSSVHLFAEAQTFRSKAQRRQQNALILFAIAPIISGVVDLLIPHLPIVELSIITGVVMIYMSLQKGQIFRDALTGINNRRLLKEYTETCIGNTAKGHNFIFFICDVDWFKTINDTYGHAEGDNALRIIGRAMRELAGATGSFVARYGGDEFCIISQSAKIESPKIMSKLLNDKLKELCKGKKMEYQISMSVGYYECDDPDETFADLMKKADEVLYKVKERRHKAHPERNRR